MRKSIPLLFTILFCSVVSYSQVTLSGSTEPTTTDNEASSVVVDPNLTVSNVNTDDQINGARVAIISYFTPGDQLNYTVALPSGVSVSYSAQKDILIFTGTSSISNYLTLLRSVTFTASASSAQDRVIEFILGSAYHYTSNNHYYEYVPFSSEDKSWTTAKNNAASMTYFGIKGYLVNITTEAENFFITQNIHKNSWIGASDAVTVVNTEIPGTYPANTNQWDAGIDGKFYWVTGPLAERLRFYPYSSSSPINYFNWHAGEPGGGMSENFAQIVLTGELNGTWEDMSNDGYGQVPGYIVEYGGLEANEPVPDLKHTRTIRVQQTEIKTTLSKLYYEKDSRKAVDPSIEVTSGGLITNAKVFISGNFDPIDYLYYEGGLPSGISKQDITGGYIFTGTATPAAWEDLFRRIYFLSNSTNKSERTVTFSLGNLEPAANGHYYEYVALNPTTWKAARDAAAARYYMGKQGYLATITTAAENELITKMTPKDSWIGGSDDYEEINAATLNKTNETHFTDQGSSEGSFYWVTGPERGAPISTGVNTFWHPGEPNNENGIEHYIEMYSNESGAPGKWNDYPNSAIRAMIVEYGGMPTDPAIAISASRVLSYDANVLPVKDLVFHLGEKEGNVVLNWTVQGEEDVRRYDVLRSVNGSQFKKIGAISALDNAGKITYSYTDVNALDGTNSYKIVVVDEDGKQTYSEIRSIVIKGKLQLFPTVTKDHFIVDQSYTTPSILTLTDAAGRVLLKRKIMPGRTIIVTGFLTAGVYFVQVYAGETEPEVFKIIKQ